MRTIYLAAIASIAVLLPTSAAAAIIVDDSGTARNGKVGYWSSLVARNGDVAISYYCEDDHAGNPPEMYTLRFAWATGTSWQWTTVDSNYAGSDTSMARGTDGVYQILYQNWGGMGWATGAATNWTLHAVDIPADVAPSNISMVLDADNRPHVAYMNFANGGDHALRYMFFDGTNWVPGGANGGVIGTGLWVPTIGFSNSYLALDAAGTPHAAYSQPADAVNIYGEIKYATLTGGPNGTWNAESLGALGADPSLAIGTDGMPRMAFNGDAGIVYAYRTGGVWQFETVAANEWGSSIAMALSDADAPVLSFGMGANEDMYIARRESGNWTVTKIDGDGTSDPHETLGRYGTSIDVDEIGTAHVGYLAIDIYGPTHRCDLRYFGSGGGPGPCIDIAIQPAPQNPCPGEIATFYVGATSADPLNYQWLLGGVPLSDGPTAGGSVISGANTDTMTIAGASMADEGIYTCSIAANCGSVTSAAAALLLNAAPIITTPPTSATACIGAATTFTVSVNGGSLSYEWYFNGILLSDGPTGSGSTIAGATTPGLSLSGVSVADAGAYHCLVYNGCGSDISAAATLTVTTCGGGCDGDLNEDGFVDLTDLAILLGHFGDSGGVAPDDGDINGDDRIDLSDLAILLSRFGTICP